MDGQIEHRMVLGFSELFYDLRLWGRKGRQKPASMVDD